MKLATAELDMSGMCKQVIVAVRVKERTLRCEVSWRAGACGWKIIGRIPSPPNAGCGGFGILGRPHVPVMDETLLDDFGTLLRDTYFRFLCICFSDQDTPAIHPPNLSLVTPYKCVFSYSPAELLLTRYCSERRRRSRPLWYFTRPKHSQYKIGLQKQRSSASPPAQAKSRSKRLTTRSANPQHASTHLMNLN